MSRMRSYTQEFRESAIELVLSGSRSTLLPDQL